MKEKVTRAKPGTTKKIQVYLDVQSLNRAEQLGEELGLSLTQVLRVAVNEKWKSYFTEHEVIEFSQEYEVRNA